MLGDLGAAVRGRSDTQMSPFDWFCNIHPARDGLGIMIILGACSRSSCPLRSVQVVFSPISNISGEVKMTGIIQAKNPKATACRSLEWLVVSR